MKKRLLCLMASLLLCGAAIAQEPAYVRLHDNNMPVVAQVVLDEVPVTTSEWTLKAYIGDDQRGEAVIQTSLNNTYWIQVYYSTDTEDDTPVTFKIANANNQEYTSTTTLNTLAVGYGTLLQPQEIEFAATQTQSVEMANGWNWWSSYIELGDNALTQLENGLGNYGNQILSRNDGYANRVEWNGYVYWSGSLQSICNEQMYKIQTNAACDVSLSGQRASLANHPITINNGWNWIGFPSSQPISITDAFQAFSPEPNDQIKGRNGYATYAVYGSYGWWSGSLNTLEPGQGYMYKSNSNTSKELTYQSSRGTEILKNIASVNNTYQPNYEYYAYNMTVTAVVELDGEELRSEDYEVAVFAGNECRGSIKLVYVEPINRYLAFLLVSGEAEESLRFVLTDGTNSIWSKDYLMYTIDGEIGTPTEPTVLHFGPLSVDDDSQKMVNVYPNPSNDIYNIEGKDIEKVEVIDNFGQIILSKEVENDFIQISLNGRASGAYLLRVVTNNGVINNKLIKK